MMKIKGEEKVQAYANTASSLQTNNRATEHIYAFSNFKGLGELLQQIPS